MRMNKNEFAEELKNRMSQEFAGKEVTINEALKVNTKSLQITVSNVTENGSKVGPSVSLEAFYTQYEEGREIDSIVEEMSDIVTHAFSIMPKDFRLNYENVSDNIFFTIVNTAKNTELLTKVPHREIEDLSVIYRWLVGQEDDGCNSLIIRNEFAEQLGKNEEELWKLAFANTRNLMPVKVRNMEEIIREMMFGVIPGVEDENLEELNDMLNDVPEDKTMYVISNKYGVHGAANILYQDVLDKLAKHFNSDLYILPSSIHECIVMSTNNGEPDGLREMVMEVNEEALAENEVLSDHAYYYNKDEHVIKSI